MFLLQNRATSILLSLVIVIFASSIHEYAHALAAHLQGDDTAKEQGRLTLNPAAHMDVFGSLVLPFILALSGGPVFAYARPVPYNPNRLQNRRVAEPLVALAGPVSNLIQAAAGALLLRLTQNVQLGPAEMDYFLTYVLISYIYINLVLMFFNLLPIPPLDGSKVIMLFLPDSYRTRYYKFQDYALVVLLVCMFIIPAALDIDPLGAYLDATAGNLFEILTGW